MTASQVPAKALPPTFCHDKTEYPNQGSIFLQRKENKSKLSAAADKLTLRPSSTFQRFRPVSSIIVSLENANNTIRQQGNFMFSKWRKKILNLRPSMDDEQ